MSAHKQRGYFAASNENILRRREYDRIFYDSHCRRFISACHSTITREAHYTNEASRAQERSSRRRGGNEDRRSPNEENSDRRAIRSVFSLRRRFAIDRSSRWAVRGIIFYVAGGRLPGTINSRSSLFPVSMYTQLVIDAWAKESRLFNEPVSLSSKRPTAIARVRFA